MKDYKRKVLYNETIPNIINNIMLDKLFFDFKIKDSYIKRINGNQMKNYYCIMYMLTNITDQNKNLYYKNHLDKINKEFLLESSISLLSNTLSEKKYKVVNERLESLISYKLIKDGSLAFKKEKPYIRFITNDDKKVLFNNALSKYDYKKCQNICHSITKDIVLEKPNNRRAVTVRINNSIYGKLYHSFMVEDGYVYDLARNIIIMYDDYVDLLRPEVILDEYGCNLKECMIYKDDSDNFTPLLRYALSK